MSKTHYTEVELGNESNPTDEWSYRTLCGLEYTESPLSNKIDNVSCKNCIKAYKKYRASMDKYYANEFNAWSGI